MATDAVWEAFFNRSRRQRLLLSMTIDCFRFAVWLNQLNSPWNHKFAPAPMIDDVPPWFATMRKSAYQFCLMSWLLALVAEHSILICYRRPDTVVDTVLLLLTLFVALTGLAQCVPLSIWLFCNAGPTLVLVAGIEFGISLGESLFDWFAAAMLEVHPCELRIVLRDDLPDGSRVVVDLFVWYKMDVCRLLDDDDREQLWYRFPENSPLSDRKNQSPWMTSKLIEIFNQL